MHKEIPKITDAEWKVMEVLWGNPPLPAKKIVEAMKDSDGWNKNTTYTVLNRLIEKDIIRREEPSFVCSAVVAREEVSIAETRTFLDRVYSGSVKMLIKGFLAKEKLSKEDIKELKKLVDSSKNKD